MSKTNQSKNLNKKKNTTSKKKKVTTKRNSNKKKPIEQIISKDGMKDKQISAKVNLKMYNEFTAINKIQGLSNNSALNMLISKYVRENRSILDEWNLGVWQSELYFI